MTFRQAVRLLSSIGIVGLFAAGCVVRDPQALLDLNQARDAIASARQSGAAERFPDDFAALGKRYQLARGTFYACQDTEASDMARQLTTDAQALANKRVEAPMPKPPPAPAPAPANQPPRAHLIAPSEGEINTLLKFDASGSSDPDGDNLTYQWDFGDGTSGRFTWPIATHRYTAIGNYTARLRVDDGRGGSDTATASLAIIKRVVLQDDREGMVFFDFDRSVLKPAALKALTDVLHDMQENSRLRAEVVGHTDWTGTERYNMGLSRRRAESVQQFLVPRGISAERVRLDWKGESQPIASNSTRAGRAKNRRVVITLRLPPAP